MQQLPTAEEGARVFDLSYDEYLAVVKWSQNFNAKWGGVVINDGVLLMMREELADDPVMSQLIDIESFDPANPPDYKMTAHKHDGKQVYRLTEKPNQPPSLTERIIAQRRFEHAFERGPDGVMNGVKDGTISAEVNYDVGGEHG